MIETEISISVNRKSDIDLIEQKIIESKIKVPIYIREYEFSYQINFTSTYEEWELESAILNSFPGYEFTTDLERGRKEIRIQIFRYQSELSTDGWGRRIENPLNETKYLVRKSTNKTEKFNPKIKVLFENSPHYYFVNIVSGINRKTGEKGFLFLDNFESKNTKEAEILKDKLYKSPSKAFIAGFYKMTGVVDNHFATYLENKKKEIRKIQRLPRKIIRDFIKACNSFDEINILKNLDEHIVFDKRENWKTVYETDGVTQFKEYLNSFEQHLCGKDFKIRSSWSINLPNITIGVKYFPKLPHPEKRPLQKFGQIHFEIKNNKIIKIIDES